MSKRPPVKLFGALASDEGTCNRLYVIKLKRHAQMNLNRAMDLQVKLHDTNRALEWMLDLADRGNPPPCVMRCIEDAWWRMGVRKNLAMKTNGEKRK